MSVANIGSSGVQSSRLTSSVEVNRLIEIDESKNFTENLTKLRTEKHFSLGAPLDRLVKTPTPIVLKHKYKVAGSVSTWREEEITLLPKLRENEDIAKFMSRKHSELSQMWLSTI
jgi:hypothetical protein